MRLSQVIEAMCESNGKVSSIRIWMVVVTLLVFLPWLVMSCQESRILPMPIIPGILPAVFAGCKVWQRGKEGLK